MLRYSRCHMKNKDAQAAGQLTSLNRKRVRDKRKNSSTP